MKIFCFLALFATQVLDLNAAPAKLPTDVSENLNYSKTYIQFFKIKDLIDKINIKKFRALQESKTKEIEGPEESISAETETAVQKIESTTQGIIEDTLPEIDLTEEAIINDEVNVNLEALDTYQSGGEETTTLSNVAVYEEETAITTSSSAIEEKTTEEVKEEIEVTASTAEAVPTSAPASAPTTIITDAPTGAPTTVVTSESQPPIEELVPEENELLNEIDTGNDKFFISKESVDSARKYGYKILLKKINGKEVPVGKIKFSFPTLVEIDHIEEEALEEGEDESIEEKEESIKEEKEDESIEDEEEEEAEEEDESNDEDESIDEKEETIEEDDESVDEEDDSLVEYKTPGAPITENVPDLETTISTNEVKTEVETTTANTALSVTFLPPPLESVIPTVEVLDENTITEGVKQVTQDTEVAINEIKNQNPSETIVFEECEAPFSDVENMLMSLAKIIENQTPMISEILAVGKSLKDVTSPEILSRSGARLLKLLEPFLESLVPTEISGCVGESSNAMLISLSGTASQLDTIASNQINQDRANALHQSATSLQLAAWIMAQLQSSVHAIYSPEGICGEGESSTTKILGSLSNAITGYIPIVAMLGNQESVQELKDTIDALNKAQDDIEILEEVSGTHLPGVTCGASFSEMAEALENLADFVEALDKNSV